MRVAILAVALLAACRGGRAPAEQGSAAPAHAPAVAASPASVVPRLPDSEPAGGQLGRIDAEVEVFRKRGEPGAIIGALLARADVFGRLADYQEALALSEAWTKTAPPAAQREAWRARTRVLTRVHQFAAARVALERAKIGALHPSEWQDLAVALDEASGRQPEAAAVRAETARVWPSATNLASLAGNLALDGKLAEAHAAMDRAFAAVHDNSPELLAFLLFTAGRLYELEGKSAAARELFAAARGRLPTLENTAHLAQTMVATGDTTAAGELVTHALAELGRHPELLGLAAQLAPASEAATRVAEARREWERYVTALPEAFSDHAARFYLAAGADPKRALALAQQNLANRDTREARALVADAALAAHDAAAACEVVAPLVAAPALRAQRFVAWRALTACGRTAEANRLAGELGIARN